MAAQIKYKPPRGSRALTHMPPLAQTDANLTKYFGIRPGQTITG